MPDRDGYPTEDELTKIREWKVYSYTLHEFMDYVKSIWTWPDYIWRSGRMYVLVTGGWSGNEDIIRAMKENTLFWLFFWESSERGGRFKFNDLDYDEEDWII